MKKFILSIVALISIGLMGALATNYTVTQGSGTTFGSIVVGGINYAQQLICDLTTPSQCAAVSAGGAVKVDGSAATQPVSGTVTANLGTISTAATAANQATEITSLATIATNTGAAIPAGTAIIGKVGIDQTAGQNVVTGSGTAGTAAAGVLTVQGIASMTKLLVTPDSVALPANQSVNLAQVNGVTILTGTGATNTGAQRVTVSTDQATNAGAALVSGGVGVVNGGSAYETVAASQTAQALGATGGTGDYLSHCVIYPTTTTPGVVTVFDNTNAAGTNVISFPGGASSVSNLVPFAIPVGAISTAGAWKVTTGANLVVTCYGKFT